jgi:site-specific recombinase XerD
MIELTKLGKSPRSIARCLSALRQFYKFLREQKLRTDNPMANRKVLNWDAPYLKTYQNRMSKR